MAWFDSVLATPLVGVEFAPSYRRASRFREVLSPIIDAVLSRDDQVTVNDRPNCGLEIREKTGYITTVDPGNFTVEYRYAVQSKSTPGQLPELTAQAVVPYSSLLDGCVARTREVARALISVGKIQCRRTGVLMRADLDAASLPPGLEKLMEHLRRPWRGKLIKVSSVLLANLVEGDAETDRCHHHISVDTTAQAPQLDLILDWQRVYHLHPEFQGVELFSKSLGAAVDAALTYAGEVADGSYWRD